MESILDIIKIRKIDNREETLYSLLLLADPSMESITDYINRGCCYGAYMENTLVGIYVLIKTRPFIVELVNVAVGEAHQGKGIGKLLVMDAVMKAKEAKMKTLEVGTGNSSIDQLALYQKCGFRIRSIDIDFFKKHYAEEIIENGIACIDMIRLGMDFE